MRWNHQPGAGNHRHLRHRDFAPGDHAWPWATARCPSSFCPHLKDIAELLRASGSARPRVDALCASRCTMHFAAVEHFRISSDSFQAIYDRRMIIVAPWPIRLRPGADRFSWQRERPSCARFSPPHPLLDDPWRCRGADVPGLAPIRTPKRSRRPGGGQTADAQHPQDDQETSTIAGRVLCAGRHLPHRRQPSGGR